MKILQVLPRYAPAWAFGGGVRMFWLLATELARNGHEIRVATSDNADLDQRVGAAVEELVPGLVVHRFRNSNAGLAARLPVVFNRPRRMRANLPDLVRWADVVHMGESRGIIQYWTAQECRQGRAPLVWSAYGGLGSAPGLRGVYRHAYDMVITRRIVPFVSRFVAQTFHEKEVLAQVGAPDASIRQIPLCVDWREFATPPARGEFRRRIGIATDDELIVCIARLSAVKGLDVLVRALGEAPGSKRRRFLALVGADFGEKARLSHLADRLGVAGQVIFPGGIYGSERIRAYVDADVFALAPAVYEETSLAAVEAAACAAPTILTRQCEIPGLVQAAGGLVVDRRGSAIAAAYEQLFADAGLRRQMGERARRYVQRHLTSGIIAARHEAMFEELTS